MYTSTNVTENRDTKKSHFCAVGHDFEMTYLRYALRYLVTVYILEKPKGCFMPQD